MTVLIERDGPVTLITIERPAARNAVDPVTARALFDAFNDAERDAACRVTVLTGGGGNFCAGFDLKVAAQPPDPNGPRIPPHGAPMGPTRSRCMSRVREEFGRDFIGLTLSGNAERCRRVPVETDAFRAVVATTWQRR